MQYVQGETDIFARRRGVRASVAFRNRTQGRKGWTAESLWIENAVLSLASSPLSCSVSLHVDLPSLPYRDLHTNTRRKSEMLPVTVKGTQGGTRTWSAVGNVNSVMLGLLHKTRYTWHEHPWASVALTTILLNPSGSNWWEVWGPVHIFFFCRPTRLLYPTGACGWCAS